VYSIDGSSGIVPQSPVPMLSYASDGRRNHGPRVVCWSFVCTHTSRREQVLVASCIDITLRVEMLDHYAVLREWLEYGSGG
jgi:hypothetical protein